MTPEEIREIRDYLVTNLAVPMCLWHGRERYAPDILYQEGEGWLRKCVAEIDRLTMEASRLIHAKEQERHARLDHQAEVGRLRGALKDLVEALEPHPVRHGRTLISEAWLKARVALGDAGKGDGNDRH